MRDIIVIGASAGGVEALQRLASLLPRDLPAAIFAVVHISPWADSRLPDILDHKGGLPAQHPISGDAIVPGNIYVAPPDQHLILEPDSIRLWHGPKENLHRPAVNPLFRSAAVHFRKRVAGIILSGTRDDGSAGLWWVKDFGGLTVAQDPREAQFPEMPQSAIDHVAVDYVLDIADIADLLVRISAPTQAIPKRRTR